MVRLAQTPGEDGLPMVDRETVLQYTNIPDKKRVVQRFQQINQQRSQGSQQQAQSEQMQLQAQQEQKMAMAVMQQQQADKKLQLQQQIEISKLNDKQVQRQQANEQSDKQRDFDLSQAEMSAIVTLVIEQLKQQASVQQVPEQMNSEQPM